MVCFYTRKLMSEGKLICEDVCNVSVALHFFQ